jgi:hypothetical protein
MKYGFSSCLLVLFCTVGCWGNDEATEADYDDVAQAVSAMVVTDNGGGEVGSMCDSIDIATGTNSVSLSVDGRGRFVGDHLGLNYQYEVECTDADGSALTTCDDATDHAAVAVKWSGDLELSHLTASVQREGEWQISNVQDGTVEINGSSDFDLEAQLVSIFNNARRSYEVSYSADYAKIKFDRSSRRIKSGTVEYVIDARRIASGRRHDWTAKFQMDGVLQFTGNGSATLTLDKSYSYTIDTESGFVAKK